MIGIVKNIPEEVCSNHYLLRIDISEETSMPGQFVNLRIGNVTDPLLRRPFSIHNHEKNIIEIIFKVVGKGTRFLRDHLYTAKMDIIAPLGNGFNLIDRGSALLIGGGIGNAPLYYLAKELKQKNNRIYYLYGARSIDNIFLMEKYSSKVDKFIITTDDGSYGEKGYVSEFVLDLLMRNSFDRVYICGPLNMMSNITGILKQREIPFEVSIENYFGCGIGLCFACTIDTKEGLKRVCIDGPVFDGNIIKWENFIANHT